MGNENTLRYAKMLKAMADPFRLQILKLLPDAPNCKLVYNVNELIEELGGSQPNMSHHLKILNEAGIIEKKKMCNSVYFYKSKEVLESIRAFIDGLK